MIMKRVEFTEMVMHLSLYLTSEGVQNAINYWYRDSDTQAKLVNSGASQTMKSLHLKALAVDFLLFDEEDNYITDGDHAYYKLLGKRAKELGLVWGGDWTFNDAGHVEWKDD
jgi:peptidoglycan L-alanyl-D-glutamate endopeptidase CwlK